MFGFNQKPEVVQENTLKIEDVKQQLLKEGRSEEEAKVFVDNIRLNQFETDNTASESSKQKLAGYTNYASTALRNMISHVKQNVGKTLVLAGLSLVGGVAVGSHMSKPPEVVQNQTTVPAGTSQPDDTEAYPRPSSIDIEPLPIRTISNPQLKPQPLNSTATDSNISPELTVHTEAGNTPRTGGVDNVAMIGSTIAGTAIGFGVSGMFADSLRKKIEDDNQSENENGQIEQDYTAEVGEDPATFALFIKAEGLEKETPEVQENLYADFLATEQNHVEVIAGIVEKKDAAVNAYRFAVTKVGSGIDRSVSKLEKLTKKAVNTFATSSKNIFSTLRKSAKTVATRYRIEYLKYENQQKAIAEKEAVKRLSELLTDSQNPAEILAEIKKLDETVKSYSIKDQAYYIAQYSQSESVQNISNYIVAKYKAIRNALAQLSPIEKENQMYFVKNSAFASVLQDLANNGLLDMYINPAISKDVDQDYQDIVTLFDIKFDMKAKDSQTAEQA